MYQQVIVVGNLGNEPTLRYTAQGNAVASFRVAVNRRWTDPDGQTMEEVCWFSVSAWGKLAEACNQHLKVGRLVLVEGQLQPDRESGSPRVWTDKQGQARASYELRARVVQFLGRSEPTETAEATDDDTGLEADQIPF